MVNHQDVLIDIYARTDITHLAKNHAYTQLQHEEMTVQQALAIGREAPAAMPEQIPAAGSGMGQLSASFRSAAGGSGSLWISASLRAHSITRNDTLRTVVERLADPGVNRLMVIDANTRTLEGIVSLTDIATYLFLSPRPQSTASTNERIRSLSPQ